MHLWHFIQEYATAMASRIPLSPSAQMIRISFIPRFFRLFNTPGQFLELSFSAISIVSTSFFSFALIPNTTYAAGFQIIPYSLTE